MSPQAQRDADPDAPGANEILASILDEVGDLASLIELVYLSREPGALEMLRWIASLSEKPRSQLMRFIAEAGRRRLRVRPKGNGLLLTTAA